MHAIAQGHTEHHPSVLTSRKIHQNAGATIVDGDLISQSRRRQYPRSRRAPAYNDLIRETTFFTAMGPGTIKLHEPLSRHTTMRMGGPAQFWAEPETEEGFADLVCYCFDHNIPLMVMGRGSNLLVRDGGIPGVVAHLTRGEFSRHEVRGNEITAGVGLEAQAAHRHRAQCAAPAASAVDGRYPGQPWRQSADERRSAMELETFQQVVRVRFRDQDGNIFTRTPAEMEVHYRDTPTLRNNYALSATLRGVAATPEEIQRKIGASRNQAQGNPARSPPAPDRIFKNPNDDSRRQADR